jgi:hypothetical protein
MHRVAVLSQPRAMGARAAAHIQNYGGRRRQLAPQKFLHAHSLQLSRACDQPLHFSVLAVVRSDLPADLPWRRISNWCLSLTDSTNTAFDEERLALSVGFDIMRVPLSQVALDPCIGLQRLRMHTQVVAEGQHTFEFLVIAGQHVQMACCPCAIRAVTQFPAKGLTPQNAAIPMMFETYGREPVHKRWQLCVTLHDDADVENGFGWQIWHRGAAHVFDGNCQLTKRVGKKLPPIIELARPQRVVVFDDDCPLGHSSGLHRCVADPRKHLLARLSTLSVVSNSIQAIRGVQSSLGWIHP